MRLFASRTTRRPASVRRAASVRPWLEALEDRCLLSAGSLDPTFGSGGIVTTQVTKKDGGAAYGGSVIQPDGKIVAGGTAGTFAMVRYTTSGALDNTFGSGGKVTTAFTNGAGAMALALYPSSGTPNDGKLVLAGNASGAEFGLARYNPNGSLDLTFGTQGKVSTIMGTHGGGSGFGVALQSDGKAVLVGMSYQLSPIVPTAYIRQFALARYNVDGSLDTSFGSGGKVITFVGGNWGEIQGVAVQGDGKIVVAGYGRPAVGPFFAVVGRYNADGSLDASFGGSGLVSVPPFTADTSGDQFHALVLQPDGKIVAVGSTVSRSSPGKRWALARLDTSGNLDPAFGTGGEVISSVAPGLEPVAWSVALQTNGKIVAAGETGLINNTPTQNLVARYDAAGSLDTTFGSGGVVKTLIGTSSTFLGVAIQPADGKIVASGWGGVGFAVARFLGDAPGAVPLQTAATSGATLAMSLPAAALAGPLPATSDGITVTTVSIYSSSVCGASVALEALPPSLVDVAPELAVALVPTSPDRHAAVEDVFTSWSDALGQDGL